MSLLTKMRLKLEGVRQAISRYPLTTIFLIAVFIVMMQSIENNMKDYSTYLFTFIVGALLATLGQHIHERFFMTWRARIVLMISAIILAIGYYFTLQTETVFSLENGVKTSVIIFALVISIVWIPSIKSETTFNMSFMSAFKAFFMTVLFTGVIIAGIRAIMLAIDVLLVQLDYKIIAHIINFVLSLFAPLFLLSFIPKYFGKADASIEQEKREERAQSIQLATASPKILSVLVSYIIIPIVAIYTIILIVYVVINIRGQFWTENLLEPLLVSYAITVILVYILASHLDNLFAHWFRKIFPKILIPIVLFQTIASILKIGDMGLTHGRYYVIMFGIFAVISAIMFSFWKVEKNGRIAFVLLVFSAISIIPPMDAFTVSRNSQLQLLETVLVENGMLKDGKVVANAGINRKDKERITSAMDYLNSVEYLDQIDWLPENIYFYNQFKETFGFDPTYPEQRPSSINQFASLDWSRDPVVPLGNYDVMLHLYTNSADTTQNEKTIPFTAQDKSYTLEQKRVGDFFNLTVRDDAQNAVIEFSTKRITDEVLIGNQASYENKGDMLTVEQATLTEENGQANVKVVINSTDAYDSYYSADFYLFIHLK